MATALTAPSTERAHLTPDRIRKMKPVSGKAVYFFDDDPKQLCVRVTESGAKSFVFRGKLAETSIRITIGSTDAKPLEDARAECRRLKNLVEAGIDPRALAREKAEAKAVALAEKTAARKLKEDRKRYTLKALCLAYVDNLRAKGKTKSATDTHSAFSVNIFAAWPDYSEIPAQEITSHQIAAIVRKVRESGKERTAGILRNYLTAAYNAARRAPFDSSLPSALIAFEISTNPAELVPTIPVTRGSRTLSTPELKRYMESLGEDSSGLALRVALFAGGQRVAQLLRAKVGDFDSETNTLRLLDIKGKRSQPREHLIPLALQAASIVKALAAKRKSPDDRIFGVREQSAGNRVAKISAKLGAAPFTLRDIRRTVETQLASMGIHKDTRAQLLSHGISGVQAAHYDRYEYFNEKRNALVAWEKRLDEIASGESASNVVSMIGAAA